MPRKTSAPRKTARTRKKEVKKKQVEHKKERANVWRSGFSAEKYHEKLVSELVARSRGKGEKIAPDLSVLEFKDYKDKYGKKHPELIEYLEAPPRSISVSRVRERNASVKGSYKVF